MKFGVLEHGGVTFDKDSESGMVVNVGDAFQIMAVKNLYHKMNIPDEEIIHIEWLELNEYKGEYVVLPINISMFINSEGQNIADMPRNIIPVFIGASFNHTNVTKEQFLFFKRHEPIGCRDERTMEILRRNGIEAYLAGCIACTLPGVKQNDSKTKVFFADAPALIRDYIPEEIKKDMVCLTHEFFVSKETIAQDPSSEEIGKEMIKRYAEEARMVVTSRFHSACLCLALGIPVILAVENNYYKFSWLSKILPLYTPEQFQDIDWNPKAIKFDSIKKKMQDVAIDRIMSVYKKNSYYELSEYFENPYRSDADSLLYYHGACRYIDEEWDDNSEIRYAFWGMIKNAVYIDEHIQKFFPNAKLVAIFDMFKDGNYRGLTFQKPTQDNLLNDIFIIVTSNSAADIAEELFHELGRKEDSYYICRLDFLRE